MCLKQLRSQVLLMILGSFFAFGQSTLRLELSSSMASGRINGGGPLSSFQEQKPVKSVMMAIAYSLVLPGLGDLYAENFGTGKYFMGAVAAFWLTYGGVRIYGQWLKNDARTLAVQSASANFDGKDDKFEVNLGNFSDVLSYNYAKLRNREFDLVYDPRSNYAWQWSSDADRLHYKDLRNRGQSALSNSQFVLGALVLNRVIAAISAARSVSAYNRSVQAASSWRVSATVPGGMLAADGIELTFSREF